MSYSVNHADVANYGGLVVEDKTINTDTSLSLVGRFYPGYSKHISENFLHMLENFASAYEPLNPTTGQLWYDTDSLNVNPHPNLKMWSGSRWIPAGLATRSSYEPSAIVGDIWVDLTSNTPNIKLNQGVNKWIPVSNPIGTIIPYASIIPPAGYVLCNGQSLLQVDYPELYAVIDSNFGIAVPGEFKVPNIPDLVSGKIKYYIYTGVIL